MSEGIKSTLANFLMEKLDATLSMEKTTVTDITKSPAHFLGFELMCKESRRFEMKRTWAKKYYKNTLFPRRLAAGK